MFNEDAFSEISTSPSAMCRFLFFFCPSSCPSSVNFPQPAHFLDWIGLVSNMSNQQSITSTEVHPESFHTDREEPTLESASPVSNTPTLTDTPASKGLSASSSIGQSEGEATAKAEEGEEVAVGGGSPKDVKFWLIIVGLLLATFLAALDLTSISTALPTSEYTSTFKIEMGGGVTNDSKASNEKKVLIVLLLIICCV